MNVGNLRIAWQFQVGKDFPDLRDGVLEVGMGRSRVGKHAVGDRTAAKRQANPDQQQSNSNIHETPRQSDWFERNQAFQQRGQVTLNLAAAHVAARNSDILTRR